MSTDARKKALAKQHKAAAAADAAAGDMGTPEEENLDTGPAQEPKGKVSKSEAAEMAELRRRVAELESQNQDLQKAKGPKPLPKTMIVTTNVMAAEILQRAGISPVAVTGDTFNDGEKRYYFAVPKPQAMAEAFELAKKGDRKRRVGKRYEDITDLGAEFTQTDKVIKSNPRPSDLSDMKDRVSRDAKKVARRADTIDAGVVTGASNEQ